MIFFRNSHIILFLVASAMIVTCSLETHADDDTAIISYIQGSVSVKKSGGQAFKAAEVDMTLVEGDTVRTGADSRVRIVTEDGSSFTLSALSSFTIGKSTANYDSMKRTASFNLESGKARATVQKLETNDSSFEVNTPTAVAGVRGTDFVVEVDPDTEDSVVTVLDGDVDVSDKLGRMKERIRLGKDEAFDVSRARAPERPRRMNLERLNMLKNEMARYSGPQDPNADPDDVDDQAASFLAARRAKIPADKLKDFMDKVKSGELPPKLAKKVLFLIHKGVPPDSVFQVLRTMREKEMTKEDVENLVKEIKKSGNAEDVKKAIEKFKKDAEERPARQRRLQKENQSSGDGDEPKKPEKLKEKIKEMSPEQREKVRERIKENAGRRNR